MNFCVCVIGSQSQPASVAGHGDPTLFSGSRISLTPGGKASLQPKRTPVTNEEIEAILVCYLSLLLGLLEILHLVSLYAAYVEG